MPYKLSHWSKIDILAGLFSVAAALLYGVISGLFRGRSGADTYHNHIIQGVDKKLTIRLSPLQLQYTFRSYDQIYREYCRKHEVKPHFVSTELGVKGFWIGDPSAKYIVMNFHGGGFAMDATEQHLEFWSRIHKDLADAGIETAWFHCTYTLTPHGVYPVQFREAVGTLRYVLDDLGRSPGEVLISGDSAGGSLCLAILSHMRHPSEDVPELDVREPLKGAILLSPWVSFSPDWPSMVHNEHKDIDAQEVTARWSQLYLNEKASNNYIEAVDAPEEWWDGIQVGQTLVLAGADKVLIDTIKAWTTKFQKFNPNTTLVVGENECHVAPLIWPMFGDCHETKQEHALKRWLLDLLG